MSRSTLSFVLFTVALSAMPLSASAAGLVGFSAGNPIIPAVCNCSGSAAGWGCVLKVLDNLVSFSVSIAVMIATLVFAYAGFLWVMNPTNPENRTKGRTIMWNAVIGFLIVLGAWLIVNTVLAALGEKGAFDSIEKATTVLNGGTECIVNATYAGTNTGGAEGSWGNGAPDSHFDYDNYTAGGVTKSISDQIDTASNPLKNLISCISQKVPGDVGRISSISDSKIVNSTQTETKAWQNCRDGNCAHESNSCHYGGPRCGNESYAVDFGDEEHTAVLSEAAKSCESAVWLNPEGAVGAPNAHLHVSIGAKFNCGCDTSGGW